MILLQVQHVRKHFGPDPVLADVTFDLRPGERVGLVGPNGAGKSTLMKIIARQLEPDAGGVELHSGSKFGYLEQQPEFEPERTVWETAKMALAPLLQLVEEAEVTAHQLAATEAGSEHDRLAERFDALQHELHVRDAYHLQQRIERVLQGLGFARSAFEQTASTLSGGQQNRLLLAQLLLAEPDLMLLDEPSNHLDIEATQWLEDFLGQTRQAILVVSHDRYFLDKVTNRTLELFEGTVEDYAGNFSAYWRQKAERVEVQRRTFERQQEEIAKLEDFVRRNHYGQKHSQAEDRRKKLERLERVPPPRIISAPVMGFPEVARSGDIVLRVEHLSKGFGRPLFENLGFDVLRGEKWGILGPNGSGKTTLLKCLVREHEPDAGQVIFGTGVKLGYFDQHLHCLDSNEPVIDAIRVTHKEFLQPQRRALLARFGLTGDQAFQAVSSLSGGERNRAALAWLAALDANLLVLDEPTNHLDLWARDSLERSLKEFAGSVVFVSHDRYFLNRVCDHVLVVEPNRFRVVEGNYDTYRMLAAIPSGSAAPNVKQAAQETSDEAGARRDKPRRKRKFPYRKAEEIEKEIHEHESQIAQLHTKLALPEVLRDGRLVKDIMTQVDATQALLAQLYEHWEECNELN